MTAEHCASVQNYYWIHHLAWPNKHLIKIVTLEVAEWKSKVKNANSLFVLSCQRAKLTTMALNLPYLRRLINREVISWHSVKKFKSFGYPSLFRVAEKCNLFEVHCYWTSSRLINNIITGTYNTGWTTVAVSKTPLHCKGVQLAGILVSTRI